MAEEKKQENKEKEPEQRFNVVEVPTQSQNFVADSKTDKLLDDKSFQAEMLNRLDRIEKALGWLNSAFILI